MQRCNLASHPVSLFNLMLLTISRGEDGRHRTNFRWGGWLDQFHQPWPLLSFFYCRLYKQSWCSRMEFGWGESRRRDGEFPLYQWSRGWGRGEGRDEETHPWASCLQADTEPAMFCLYGAKAALRQGASSGAWPMDDGCHKLNFFFFF